MSITYSIIFICCGAFFEVIYFFLEKAIISAYSYKGVVRNKTLYRVPFELMYWSKFPLVSTVLYYMVTKSPQEFTLMQILFYFSLFAMGMFVLAEFFKDLRT